METPENKKKQRKAAGWLTAVGVHAVIAVLLLIFGFVTPLPKPETEGISVQLGIPDAGGPDEAFAPQQSSSSDAQQATEFTENSDNAALPDNPSSSNETSESNNQSNSQSRVRMPDPRIKLTGGGNGNGQTPGQEGVIDGDGVDNGDGNGWGNLDGLGSGRRATLPPIGSRDQSLCGGHIEIIAEVSPNGNVVRAEPITGSKSRTDITDRAFIDKAVAQIKNEAKYTSSTAATTNQKAIILITIDCY